MNIYWNCTVLEQYEHNLFWELILLQLSITWLEPTHRVSNEYYCNDMILVKLSILPFLGVDHKYDFLLHITSLFGWF